MNAKEILQKVLDDLAAGAKAQEARAEKWVDGKIDDAKAAAARLMSRPVALGLVAVALLLGLLVGWSLNESRHYRMDRPADAAAMQAIQR